MGASPVDRARAVIVFPFAFEEWASYIHLEDRHDLDAQAYEKYHGFAKPVFLGEDRYEQDIGADVDPAHMRYWQRRLFWAWLLTGGSTNYGGRWWGLHPYSRTGERPATIFWHAKHIRLSGALTGLDSVLYIREYFAKRQIELSGFEPEQRLVADAEAASGVRSPKLMRRGDDEFLIYHPNAAEDGIDAHADAARAARLRIDLRSVHGRFATEWYRAEDGAFQAGVFTEGGAYREFTSPWTGADVVLRLLQVR